jgi:acyl carrier protein
MGLDGVEILLATEEAFGIAIPDEVAERLLTPADVVAHVASQVPTTPSAECLTQRLFYRLRQRFRAQVPALVGRFDPDNAASRDHPQGPVASGLVGETVPWPGLLKDGPRTVRQLIWHLVASLPPPRVEAGESWTRERIEGEVRRIIGEHLGVKDYRLDARFVEDLGLS